MSDTAALVLAFVLLTANAFFVAAEFALISARRTTIEPRALAGSIRATVTLGAMEHVSLMMAGAQLGITVCSLGLGAVAEPALAHLLEAPFDSAGLPEAVLHPVAFAIALAIVVFLHVVIGEMVPKNLALAGPDRAAMLLAPPLVLMVRALSPLIRLLNAVANASLRAVKVQPKDEVTSAFTRDEVAGLVEQSRQEGLLNPEGQEMLTGALDFDQRDAGSVLLPLNQLITVTARTTPREVERLVGQTGFSRFPVRGDGGDFIGYVHLKDVLDIDPDARELALHQEWIRPLVHVELEDALSLVLHKMQQRGAHLAAVTDSQGQLLGVAALEDVVEQIVGEIRDETRQPRP
ncbi:MAG: hemolysin family protein [Mycobacteriales bacterium]